MLFRSVLNFNDGDIFLFGPGFAHCFYNEKNFISSGETAHAIVIFFKEDFLGKDFFKKPELERIKDLLDKTESGIKVNKSDEFMRSFFHKILKEKKMDALLSLLQLLNTITVQPNNLSLINTAVLKPSLKHSDSSKLEAVFKYVIENFKEDLDSKHAASLACLNEAAFCRYFKRRTEKTFSQFVNYVRITHALNLLIEKEGNIANICFECGFKNVSYFNRQFKDIIGQTPMEYRKAFFRDDDLIKV